MPTQNFQALARSEISSTWFEKFNFLIVDADQRQSIPAEWPCELLLPQGFEENEGLMPSVLDMNQLDKVAKTSLFELINHAYQQKEAAPVSALIIANCTQNSLKMHLCRSQTLAHNGHKAWLRIFDSRVWSQLPRVMGVERMRLLFGPIQCWSTALYGEWADTYPMDMQDTLEAQNFNWQALVRVGLVNRTLSRLGRLSWNEAQNLGPTIDQLIDRAENTHKLSKTEDLVSFAYYGIKYGLNFDTHPTIQRRISLQMQLANEGREDTTVVDILNMIDDTEWKAIQ